VGDIHNKVSDRSLADAQELFGHSVYKFFLEYFSWKARPLNKSLSIKGALDSLNIINGEGSKLKWCLDFLHHIVYLLLAYSN
jgi:hypothetical protein